MNTIKIFLATSGRIAELKKDFPLYQGSYQNKLLNIYVPTSILAPEFTTQSASGTTTGEYVAGTAIEIGMTYTARDGSIKVSKNSYMRFLKTLTYQNVEYALYERMLPKEFTLYAGQGTNAPTLIINVVNIQTDTSDSDTDTTPTVLSIITSQTCSLDVMASTNLDQDDPIEATELETINARLNSIDATLALKQNITDTTLETTAKTVVGAINEVKSVNDTQTTQISANSEDIATNTNDIDWLKQHMATPEIYIGQLIGTTLPTDSELTAFVAEKAGRQPQNSDVVIFILELSEATDKNYKYTYSVEGWNGYEIPAMELASNGTAGLVQGTYAIGDTNGTLVNISGGKILNIYLKDNDGTYRDAQEYANSLNTSIANIVSGDTTVGQALKAIQDANGNSIIDTYLTATAGATKQYVRDYALPREFNDTYYIASTGYQKTKPTEPETGIQFTTTTNSVGDFTLFQLEQTIDADFELSNKNAYMNNVYVSANVGSTVQFRLTTQARNAGGDWVDLAVDLSDTYTLTAGDIKKIGFGGTFDLLDDETILTLTDGDFIRQTLEVVTTTSVETTFSVYSNETYASTFGLTVKALSVKFSSGLLGEQPVIECDGTLENDILTFVIPNSTTLNDNTECLFKLSYAGDYRTLADTTLVAMTYNDQVVSLTTPYNFGSSNGVTLANLLQAYYSYNSAIGSDFYFKAFVQVDSSIGMVTILIDIDNLTDYADKDYVASQDEAYIGRIDQLSFNAVLENNQIIGSLDESIADFELTPNTQYLVHLYLPLTTITGDLDDTLPVYLKDKDGNLVYINCISQQELGQTSTVGDLCQVQKYNTETGYTWNFEAYYRETVENDTTTRYVYTDTIVAVDAALSKTSVLPVQNKVITNTLDTYDIRLTSTENNVTGLTTRVGTAETNISTNTNNIATNKAAIETANTTLTNLTTRVTTAEREIDTNTTSLMTVATDLTEEVTRAKDEEEALQTQISTNTTDITSLEDRMDATETATMTNATNIAKAVFFTEQTLTDNQKAQARSNIGAGDSAFTGNFDDLSNVPTASTGTQGIIQIATDSEATTGTNTTKAVTPKQLKMAIEGLGTVFDLKGSVATVSALPTSGNEIGDVYYVISESVGYIWLNDGTSDRWEQLGLAVDLSTYMQFSDIVNNVTSTDSDKPLSAYQGKVLKDLIDTINTTLTNHTTKINTNEDNIASIQSDITDIDTNLNMANADIDDLQDRMTATETATLTNATNISTNTTNITNLTTTLNTKPGLIVKGSVASNKTSDVFNDLDDNTSTGDYSHAEGSWTKATGEYSHAEGGGTTASGSHSHAEGNGTVASGFLSHAGGNFTIADQSSQTAVGQYNKEGQTGALFSVGNGTGSSARSTAFEVFQDGHVEIGGASITYDATTDTFTI